MIITLYRTGKDGKTHYYTIHDRQLLLDSPYALCASWRIGMGKERERIHRFQTLLERDAMIRKLISMRVKDGYRILYTFTRSGFAVGSDPATSSDRPARDPGSEAVSLPGP
jgi:hypothetical protein